MASISRHMWCVLDRMRIRRRARPSARSRLPVHNTHSPIADAERRRANPMYACLYQPPAPDVCAAAPRAPLEQIAREFSPRYERHRDNLVSIDVSGLERMLGRRQHLTDRGTEDGLPSPL